PSPVGHADHSAPAVGPGAADGRPDGDLPTRAAAMDRPVVSASVAPAPATHTRHCSTCRCSTAAAIERRFRDDVAALEYAGETELLSRSMLPAARGTVYGTLAWRTEGNVRRVAAWLLR